MTFVMYDDVNLKLIPKDAKVVAGYVNGRWANYADSVKGWPDARHVSIAVTAEADADVLDIERGDAFPSQAPTWVRRQFSRGVERPGVYCSLSDAKKVVDILSLSGIPRRKYKLITAHYNGEPHICTKACGYGMPTTADGTQFTDRALERSLDESLLADTFFVTSATRRAALRAWILVQRAHGATWTALKKTARWKLWRKLGGK